MEPIKYLHIMTHPSSFFNEGIIRMINYDNINFHLDEHLFLVSNLDIYKKYKSFDNVIYIPKIMTKNYKKFIRYSKQCKYIFLHQNWFYDFKRFILTPRNIKKKYIWCVWGHDLYTGIGKIQGIRENLKLFLRRLGDKFINHEIKYYKGIGIGCKYDSLEIKKRFKNKVKILMCPYISGSTTEQLNIIQSKNLSNIDNRPIKIMVAHSAHPYLNHKEMLNKLSKYKNENILISLVLAYGNDIYAKEVELYATEIFGSKVEVIKEKVELDEYLRYLNTVDIGVFDQIHQSGLANLYYLMYFGKKIYVNKDGFIRQFCILEGIDLDTTDKLGLEKFEELISSNIYKEKAKEYASFMCETKNLADMWKMTLKMLD